MCSFVQDRLFFWTFSCNFIPGLRPHRRHAHSLRSALQFARASFEHHSTSERSQSGEESSNANEGYKCFLLQIISYFQRVEVQSIPEESASSDKENQLPKSAKAQLIIKELLETEQT